MRLMIDSGDALKVRANIKKLKEFGLYPIHKVVLTHTHWDHAQGLPKLIKQMKDSEVEVLASENAIDNLKHPEKIKNIVDLPASKEDIKIAIKILLTVYVIKKSEKKVDILKDYYISMGSFQSIDLEDKEKIIEEANSTKQKLENASASFFSTYHKYMEVIISEQDALLKDLNNFINDIETLT